MIERLGQGVGNEVGVRRLSKSEWELMLHCWKLGSPTAREVHRAAAAGPRRRDYRTVLATLNNVADKGFLRVEKCAGPRNIPTNRYLPTISFEDGVSERIEEFLRDDLGGDPEAFALLRSAIDAAADG